MRDMSGKTKTLRTAKATATLHCLPGTIKSLEKGTLPKGDPLPVARVAGIQAAKATSTLIPYCHQVPLDSVSVDFEVREASIHIHSEVKAIWSTGVEMEALAASSVAALTLYDMLKIIDETMEIDSVRLLEKKGGKSGWKPPDVSNLKAGVLVMSDRISGGQGEDRSGKFIKRRLEEYGFAVVDYRIIPDVETDIRGELLRLCDDARLDLVMTTGGTGVGPRDVTPEATSAILGKTLPGVIERMQHYANQRTPFAMFSRAVAGVRGRTVVINLPGAEAAVDDCFSSLFPWVLHLFPMLKGGGHEAGKS